MHVTIYKNADQTFRIFYFLCIFGFLTQKQVKIDQKNNIQSIQKKKKNTHTHTHTHPNLKEHAIQVANRVVCALH